MSVHAKLSGLVGEWKGTNRLYFSPTEPVRESESVMSVSLKANGQFIDFEYTWAYENQPQQGLMLLGCDSKSDAVQAIWTDSWHMSHKFMVCDGKISDNGVVDVKGFYSVPDHPDWGWRTEIIPGDDVLRVVMYNVTPDGEEEMAVETDFSRI